MSAAAVIAALMAIDWDAVRDVAEVLIDGGASDEEISDAVCELLDAALALPQPYELLADSLTAAVVPPLVAYLRTPEAQERRQERRERRQARRAARKARRSE